MMEGKYVHVVSATERMPHPVQFVGLFCEMTMKRIIPCSILISSVFLSACGISTSADSKNISNNSSYISPSDASNYLGQYETVRFNVGHTFTDSAGTEFLDQYQNYATGFVVSIFSSDLRNFSLDPASTYEGSTVDVSGMVSTYNGYIQILNPDSIVKVN